MKISIGTFGLITILISTWHLLSAQSTARASLNKSGFKGNILAVSDADMIATAYADGILNKINGIEDTLTAITIQNGKPIIRSQHFASNSVVSWPAILEWHPTQKYAYVAESKGIYKGKENKVKNAFTDLPHGRLVSVIDYTNFEAPKVIQTIKIGEDIQSVSINQSGDILVAGAYEDGKGIIIAPLADGQIGAIQHFSAQHLAKEVGEKIEVRTIEFHPTENIIAVNLNNDHLIFYEITRKNNAFTINQLGKAFKVAKHWSVGNWHPSGKYFLFSDVAWGKGRTGFVFNKKGKLKSIKFDKQGMHKIVSEIKVDLSPEGFDISPSGQYAITVNMRRSYLPKKFWFIAACKGGSLSLIKVDGQTGKLTKLGKDYGFEGALPEDVIFDQEGNSIAVAIYQEQFAEFPTKGWIDFWEIQNDKLVKTQQKLEVTRGVHNLLLVPNVVKTLSMQAK